jgi:hypothetical protein
VYPEWRILKIATIQSNDFLSALRSISRTDSERPQGLARSVALSFRRAGSSLWERGEAFGGKRRLENN